MAQPFFSSIFLWLNLFHGWTFLWLNLFIAEFFYDSTICWLNCLKNFTVDFNFFFVLENKFHYCTVRLEHKLLVLGAGARFGPRQIRTESVMVRPRNHGTGDEPFNRLQVVFYWFILNLFYSIIYICIYLISDSWYWRCSCQPVQHSRSLWGNYAPIQVRDHVKRQCHEIFLNIFFFPLSSRLSLWLIVLSSFANRFVSEKIFEF